MANLEQLKQKYASVLQVIQIRERDKSAGIGSVRGIERMKATPGGE